MGSYEALADLPLEVSSYTLEGLGRAVSSGFLRLTTLIRLAGGGERGVGEDVIYDDADQIALQTAGAGLPLAGSFTLASFSERLEELDLFPTPPVRPTSREYRRWAFESAALDLALRQSRLSLAEALGRTLRPLSFVVSLRLPEPPTVAPVLQRLSLYPGLRFKLDPTPSWQGPLLEQLAQTGAVAAVDFKAYYEGTPVDLAPDPALYARVAEAFPDAWIEDPALTPETDAALRPYRDRVTWDAPIHSVADIEARPFPPRMVNIKPSRFGPLRALFAAYDHCEAHGIGMYGGGQFELGPGRGQIQYLASLFHADAPNDVAPTAYNEPEAVAGLHQSPLPPAPTPTGFGWEPAPA